MTARTRVPAVESAEAWHTLPAAEVSRRVHTEPERGLSDAEASRRLERYGPNALTEKAARSAVAILGDQFKSLIVVLLVAATAVAVALDEGIEAAAIVAVIILNALVGFLTELKAEQALTALRKQLSAVAHVIRDGREHQVSATGLVPGDVVALEAGARVPADGRVIVSARLQAEEAALTGESQPVAKTTDPIPDRHRAGRRPAEHALHGHDGDGRAGPDDRHRHRHPQRGREDRHAHRRCGRSGDARSSGSWRSSVACWSASSWRSAS